MNGPICSALHAFATKICEQCRLRTAIVFCIALVCSVSAAETNRPSIGLVLGGGGVKGFAHIGVLQVLEELRVPIDFIGGTSMGAIVGGLYASGLSPSEIEATLLNINWWDMLKDKSRRSDLSFRRKRDDLRYLLDLEVGFNARRLQLPTGLASGQKLNNYLRTLTFNTVFVQDFDRLNVPFRAVATDIETGEEVVLRHGNLARAIRASMAVPGAFTPVRSEGRLLIDGGIVNNIPVDVVRGMGADVIIAVDLGAMDVASTRKHLQSLGEILAQTYQLMRRPKQDEQMARADIAITPNVADISASAFERVAAIIPRGREAVLERKDAITPYSASSAAFERYLQRQRRGGIDPVVISSIHIEGHERVDERLIRSQVKSKAGLPMDFDGVESDLSRIHGLGDFEHVEYSIRSDGDQHALVYVTKEKPWGPGYVHFGLRLDADSEDSSSWAFLLNYSRRQLNALGGEWLTDIEVGETERIFSEWYQPLDFYGALFIAPNVEFVGSIQDVYVEDQKRAEYEVDELYGRVDLGVQMGKYGQARIGVIFGEVDARVNVGDVDLPRIDEQVGAWTGSLTLDRLDTVVFTREGYQTDVTAFLGRESLGQAATYEKLSFRHDHFVSIGEHTVSIRLQGGTSLGSEIPAYDEFLLGGLSSLAGLADDQLRGQYMGAARLAYQYRMSRLPSSLGRGLYIGGWADAGNVWEDSDDIDFESLIHGYAVGLGADTLLGPAYVTFGQAEGGFNRFYFSLGSNF